MTERKRPRTLAETRRGRQPRTEVAPRIGGWGIPGSEESMPEASVSFLSGAALKRNSHVNYRHTPEGGESDLAPAPASPGFFYLNGATSAAL